MPVRTTTRLAIATLLVAMLCGCGSGSSSPEPSAKPTPTGNPAGRALAYQVQGMAKIAARTTVYAEPGEEPLEMDLYLPRDGSRAPVVLLLHGVTPDASPKDYGGLVGWGQALAASGLAAAVINYRADESGKGPADDDVRAAIQALRRADRVDMSRWGLLTFSAGGPYGVRTAASTPEGLSAVAFFYARTEPAEGRRTPATSLSALVAQRPDLPVFAAYGALDRVDGIASSQRRLEATVARSRIDDVKLLVHPSAGHGFDVGPDDDSRAIVRSGIEFFLDQLGG